MSQQTILLVGHGSRNAQALAEFHDFTTALGAAVGRPVHSCFLELADPDMATGISAAAGQAGPGGEVVILPIFLGSAGHQKSDVAAAVQWARGQFPGVTFRYGTPLGFHAKLIDLLDLRIRQALAADAAALLPQETSVLVVGRGSSDPDSNSEIARTAYLLFERRPYLSVEYAYQAVARPSVAEGVRRCYRLGARQVIVVPYILFTGDVELDIRRVAGAVAAGLDLHVLYATHLSPHPLLLEVAAQRLQEAGEGRAAMLTCDICKYRFPLAGYEHQVGQPQVTHHLYGGSDHHHDHGHDHDHDHEYQHEHAHDD